MKHIKFLVMAILSFLSLYKVDVMAKERSIFKWENDVSDVMDVFAPKLAQDNNVCFLNRGIGVILEGYEVAWSVNLKVDRQWTIEEARPVVVNMVQQFITLVYTNPAFKIYLQEQHARTPKWFRSELGPDRIGIKLAFWDKNVDRPLPPYVAQIKVVDGNILYYQANPEDQSLQKPPFSETIAEAFIRANRPLIIPSPQS